MNGHYTMSTTCFFRPAQPKDHLDLISMVLALYEEDQYDAPMTQEKVVSTLQELSAHPDKGSIFVFDENGIAAGYAIVIHYWSNEYGGNIAVIDEVYVRPACRSRGIASAFMAFIANDAALNPVGLMLEVVPTNLKAMDFYRRRGFEPDTNRHFFRLLQSV